MEHDCEFPNGTLMVIQDLDIYRVLNNDGEGITSSIETSDGSVFPSP